MDLGSVGRLALADVVGEGAAGGRDSDVVNAFLLLDFR